MQHRLAPSSIDPSSGPRALPVSLRAFQINCPLSASTRPSRIGSFSLALCYELRDGGGDSVRDEAADGARGHPRSRRVAKSILCVFGVWVFACFCFASHFFAAALSDRWGGRMERCNCWPAALPDAARFRFLLIVHGLPASWRGPNPLLSPRDRSKMRWCCSVACAARPGDRGVGRCVFPCIFARRPSAVASAWLHYQ
jgi:hypothetical protein